MGKKNNKDSGREWKDNPLALFSATFFFFLMTEVLCIPILQFLLMFYRYLYKAALSTISLDIYLPSW